MEKSELMFIHMIVINYDNDCRIQDIAYNLSSSLAKLFHQSTGYDHLIEVYISVLCNYS